MPRTFQHILLAMLAILAASCVDTEAEAPVVQEVETRTQTVTVVPTFSIAGISSLPADLHLSELGFVISEIRLEPLAGNAGSVAFSAVKPEIVKFNVAHGETQRFGDSIELPRPGRYLVSVRLEPIDSGKNGDVISSFEVAGFVAQSGGDARYAIGEDDGERPTPHPFDPDDDEIKGDADGLSDNPETPDTWTPFYYHSERAVFFTLNDVEFEAGEHQLEFTFDIHNWAFDIVDPISRAVSNDGVIGADSEGIDISRHLDSSGQGAESFVTSGRVSAMRRTGGGKGGF
jgi:hypothetical protein